MKTLEEVKQDLEGLGKKELVEAVVSLVEAEKQRGIEAHKKVNNEAANLRKFKKAVEALGFDENSDLDQFTSQLIDIKAKATTSSSDTLTVKSLNDAITKLQNDLANERKEKAESITKAKNKEIAAKLTQSLADKVYGVDLLVKSLISDNMVDMDGDDVVFKYNDEKVPFNEGLNKLLETRKDIVKNTQTGGAGSKGTNTMPSNIEAVIKSGNRSEIRKNLAEIKKQLGITA